MEEKIFAELLGRYIHESGYNNYEFAKLVGVNRVNIQRYLSGDRVPNKQIFEKIASRLHIGMKEKELLFESYRCAYDGRDLYYLKKIIRDVLEHAANLCGEEKNQVILEHVRMEKEIESVHGKAAVEKLIWSLLWSEAKSEQYQEIFCFIPADKQILGRTFPAMLKEGEPFLKNLRILHLVPLAKRSDEFRNHYYNLKVIRNLIPTYFQVGNSYETLYYYHDYPQLEFNDGLLYPYYIVSEHQVILMDSELDYALVVENPKFVAQFQQKIKDRYLGGGIENLVQYFEDEMEFLAYELQQEQDCDIRIFLEYEPCFCYWADDELLEQVLSELEQNGGKETLISIKRQIRHYRTSRHVMHYFTESGLREFAETGYCSNYPRHLVRPFSVEERIWILERMIESMEDEKCEIRLIKYKYLKITPMLALFFSDTGGLVFRLKDDRNRFRYIRIQEDSLSRAFTDYVKGMKEQEEVCSKEETKTVLLKIFDTLRKSNNFGGTLAGTY